MNKKITLAIIGALTFLCAGAFAQRAPGGQSGAGLDAYKTLDICQVDSSTWRYYGVIAIWNTGSVATQDLHITDSIQTKTQGTKYIDTLLALDLTPAQQVPGGTTQTTAVTYSYCVEGLPLSPARNIANITITNHSGKLGEPFGPSPTADWTGGTPPPCAPVGCTHTQGYWGSKPDLTWPSAYDRNAAFYLSGQTWQQVMGTAPAGGNAYYQLAHQYIAAVLNAATGASVPDSVDKILDSAAQWFINNAPTACTANGCGLQQDWAAILDLYNNGLYPGGPPHCLGQ